MKLHEAIEKLLKATGRPMSTREIADALNRNKWYQKKNGLPLDPLQIHGRTKNYFRLFKREGSSVSLLGQSFFIDSNAKPQKVKAEVRPLTTLTNKKMATSLLEKMLLNEKNFKNAASVDNIVPDKAGLYCIRMKDKTRLPSPFDNHLIERGHNIIYIGIASRSLKRRFLHQELRAMGHGTFFRSIGAVLGYKPVKGSLVNKTNKRNYTFTPGDELKIIQWINKNLTVNWVETDEGLATLETTLISKYKPLLNLAKNPVALNDLTKLRAACVTIASCP